MNEPLPACRTSLAADLRALGVRPGMTLIVHSSLKSLGWVVGGSVAVILALEDALGAAGTLVMPTFSVELSEPSSWRHPPVPESWWELIRRETPAFDPDLTPAQRMGALPETFRRQAGTLRSHHPEVSLAARGARAREVTDGHGLDFPLGEASPLARIYELDGRVLLLGVGHDSNSSLHLAEYRCPYPGRREVEAGAPLIVAGRREWVRYRDYNVTEEDFIELGAAYEAAGGALARGRVAGAEARLIPQRPLVDFAVVWLEANRKAP